MGQEIYKCMKFSVIKTISGLKPCRAIDEEMYAKLKLNQEYQCEIKRPRNYEFLKKYFLLINLGFQNSEQTNQDHYRKVLQARAGYYETILTDKGTWHIPISISFSKMSESEFNKLYDGVLVEVCKDLQTAPEDILNELNEY